MTHQKAAQAKANESKYLNQGTEMKTDHELLKKFDKYNNGRLNTLYTMDMDAVEVGFRKLWNERKYDDIVRVAGRIPDGLMGYYPKVQIWYDMAYTMCKKY